MSCQQEPEQPPRPPWRRDLYQSPLTAKEHADRQEWDPRFSAKVRALLGYQFMEAPPDVKLHSETQAEAKGVEHQARYPHYRSNPTKKSDLLDPIARYRNRIRHLEEAVEEARRDLDSFAKAYHRADCDIRDREAQSKREKQALSDEIQLLEAAKVTHSTHHTSSACVQPIVRWHAPELFLIPEHEFHDVYNYVELLECPGTQYRPRPYLRPRDHASTGAGFPGADFVTSCCQDQGKLLEEAQRDLEVFKTAYYNAEREIQTLGESFEREKQALNDEIRRLRECELHCREERFESDYCP